MSTLPRLGSRIRIVTTRTTDGETTVIEGRVEVIHEQIRPLAVELVNSHFAHIETVRQDATITWEEVEPPKPPLRDLRAAVARAEQTTIATLRGDRFERIAVAVDAASYAIHDTRTLGRSLSDVEIASIAIDAAYDVLRRAFAEEAADALQAKSGISFASYARAAEIVRQIGGTDRGE